MRRWCQRGWLGMTICDVVMPISNWERKDHLHPDPLPSGREREVFFRASAPRSGLCMVPRKSRSKSESEYGRLRQSLAFHRDRNATKAEIVSPSPGGEGRGEGEPPVVLRELYVLSWSANCFRLLF